MAEKRTTKKQEAVTPEVTVAPEVHDDASLETTATTPEVPEDVEVIENGEITEIRDNEDETVNVPKELVEQDERIQRLADEVENGMHGSGRERMILLGDDYGKVQAEVTRRIRNRQR